MIALHETVILARVAGVLARECQIPLGIVEMDTPLAALDIDTLDRCLVALALEEEFDIEISWDSEQSWRTVGDMVAAIPSSLPQEQAA